MSKKNIHALNDQLHDQLTRLNSDIKGEELKEEIEKAKAMSQIGTVIVNNYKTALFAIKLSNNVGGNEIKNMLGYGDG